MLLFYTTDRVRVNRPDGTRKGLTLPGGHLYEIRTLSPLSGFRLRSGLYISMNSAKSSVSGSGSVSTSEMAKLSRVRFRYRFRRRAYPDPDSLDTVWVDWNTLSSNGTYAWHRRWDHLSTGGRTFRKSCYDFFM